jgi:hypothetical protein
MRKYMLDHASDYIDAHRHFANKRARMTDRERDEIDEVRLRLMRLCNLHVCACVHARAARETTHSCSSAPLTHSRGAGDEHMHARVL